jgi:hypothetical protein
VRLDATTNHIIIVDDFLVPFGSLVVVSPHNFAKLEDITLYQHRRHTNQSNTMVHWCPLCPKLRPDKLRQKHYSKLAGMLCNDCYFLLTKERIKCKDSHGMEDEEIDVNIQTQKVGLAKIAADNKRNRENWKKNNPDAYVQSSFQPILHLSKWTNMQTYSRDGSVRY